MISQLQKYIEAMLLRGYAEYDTKLDDVSLKEEQIILARLILAQQIYFFSITEYMDYRVFDRIKPKLIRGFTKMCVILSSIVIFLLYGIIQFILKSSQDESLRPQAIIAMFRLTESYHPPLQAFVYFWETEDMVKLITQYINTCKALSDNSREFYKSLTLKRKSFEYFMNISVVVGLLYHSVRKSKCYHQDRRFVCGIFLTLWFPFETNYFPVREIILVVTLFVSCRAALLMVHHTIDAYILAELFEYKCQHLIKLMRNTSLSRLQHVGIVKQKFRVIVDYHQELIECFVLMRHILGRVSASGIAVFIPLCATESAAFTRDFDLAFLQEFLVAVGICYLWIDSMQGITDLGITIQEAAYDMDWYEMDKTMYKEYLIFLMKLRHPLKMQSMIFVLQKPMFLTMIRNVYSCVMLVLQMN